MTNGIGHGGKPQDKDVKQEERQKEQEKREHAPTTALPPAQKPLVK